MQIYTKKGDNGETCLYDGTRVKKNDPVCELLGTIDEMSAVLGIAKVTARKKNSKAALLIETIQKDLININAIIANAEPLISIDKKLFEYEKIIDSIKERIDIKNEFVLYGENELESSLHHARAVCRRAERICVNTRNQQVCKYLNRLSDLLYIIGLSEV